MRIGISWPRRRWALPVAGAAAAAVAAAAVVLSLTGGTPAPLDMNGDPVGLEEGARASPDADADPDIGQRFAVPAVGLDVPLGALDEVAGAIVPPGFTSAYWVRNRGVSPEHPAEGTVYVVMHSLRHGTGPGNFLIDRASASARVVPGTRITLGDDAYEVSRTLEVEKDELPQRAELWRDRPGTLVVITCMLNSDDSVSTRNLVVVADEVAPDSDGEAA